VSSETNPEKRISVLHLSAADNMLFPILREQLKYLRDAGFKIQTASIDGPLGRRIHDDDGFPWTPLPLTRSIAPFSDWRALKFIERFCREQRFDIVHTHTPKGNVIGQWAARRAGVPVVLQTLHGFYFHDLMPALKRRMWISIERFSASNSDHVLCQNPEDVETAVLEKICPREKISLLGNGIDVSRFHPADNNDPRRIKVRQELNIKPDAIVVGMVGRFVAEKGFPEFIAAGERVVKENPRIHLLVIGHQLESERAGDRWAPPEKGALSGRLSVLRNRDDMAELYACMDIHVLPSHREGFPRVLLEGAATGLPQVCTDIRGCRQAVENGKTGYFIKVGDVAALAEKIQELAADESLRKTMGVAARAKAAAEFDQMNVFKKVEACYRKLLAQRARR
jgi:glycosyltransferase involved in cell wall biosynthesis